MYLSLSLFLSTPTSVLENRCNCSRMPPLSSLLVLIGTFSFFFQTKKDLSHFINRNKESFFVGFIGHYLVHTGVLYKDSTCIKKRDNVTTEPIYLSFAGLIGYVDLLH